METVRLRLRVDALAVHWTRWNGGWTRARADATVIGGWAAYAEAVRTVRTAIANGRAILADRAHRESVAAWWERSEASLDDELLDTLSWSVPPRDGEDDPAYEARLTALMVNLRGRLDGSELVSPSVAGSRARVQGESQLPSLRPAYPDTQDTETRNYRDVDSHNASLRSGGSGTTETLDRVERDLVAMEAELPIPSSGWPAPRPLTRLTQNGVKSEPSETDLMLPARNAVVRELERLRNKREASLTDEERFRMGKRRLLRRVEEEKRRLAERGLS